jgi:hypothetical protein
VTTEKKSGHGVPPWRGESRRLPPPVARTTARCRGHSWREAFPCPSAGEKGDHGKEKWARRPAVARGIECGESSAASRGSPVETPAAACCAHHGKMPWPLLAGGLPLPLCRRERWPRKRKVATASRRGAGNRARGIKRRLAGLPCRDARRRLLRAPRQDAVATLGGRPSLAPRLERKVATEKKSGHGVLPWRGESSAGNQARPRGAPLSRRPPPPVARTTARCRGHSWREAFPCPSAGEKRKMEKKSGHGVPPWGGESRRPPPPVARTTARCRGHSWREAFPCPSAGEKGGHGERKVATASRRGAGNRAAADRCGRGGLLL